MTTPAPSLPRATASWALLLGLALVGAGCSGAGEAAGGEERRQARAPERLDAYLDLGLAPTAPGVKAIQLYPEQTEAALPVLPLDSEYDPGDPQLTLEFDLLDRSGRPLSVFFYHADRTWQRDLAPIEYLASFQRDQILDYEISRATMLPYVHYAYQFPNPNIEFLISGNYIVRVTEQGDEQAVLFERAFFLTEQAATPVMDVQNAFLGGRPYPAAIPEVQFQPPDVLQGDFYNFNVCFVRDARLERTRCSERPGLSELPFVRFFLEPENAFESEASPYFLDLSQIVTSNAVERVNLSVTPYEVLLAPDYANFPGSSFAPNLAGQAVIGGAVEGVAEPDLNAEYVAVTFQFEPPNEAPLEGEVVVTGSFNGWAYDPANSLEWDPEARRYFGTVLLKQGLYEYRYFSPDREYRRALAAAAPTADRLYTALVYYRDVAARTDRLVGVNAARVR